MSLKSAPQDRFSEYQQALVKKPSIPDCAPSSFAISIPSLETLHITLKGTG